jgi:hypothetical protein
MLSFSRHAQLGSVPTPDASTAVQAKLALHAARSLALPMGRGALTLSTVYLLPTEPLQAYKIVLDGVTVLPCIPSVLVAVVPLVPAFLPHPVVCAPQGACNYPYELYLSEQVLLRRW